LLVVLEKPVDQITEGDLIELITDAVVEQKTLEYKSELPGDQQSDKIKFLGEVSSLANTLGGTLIFGIAENGNHVPVALNGMDIPDVDREVGRLDQIIRSGITPRLPLMTIRPLRLASGKFTILVKVGRSWAAPHMVSVNDNQKFYLRSSNGKYLMDFGELQNAFGRADTLASMVRSFVQDRYSMTYTSETPIPIEGGLKLVCHIVPFTFADTTSHLVLPDADTLRGRMCPLLTNGWNGFFNLDGFCTYNSGRDGISSSYAQLFRNGVIEALVSIDQDDRTLYPEFVEDLVVTFNKRYFPLLRDLGVSTPLAIHTSLLGTKGYIRGVARGSFTPYEARPITKEQVVLPIVQLDDYTTEVEVLLKPAFDALGNALGQQRSLSYNAEGIWTRARR
jgi:hypothetical protein